jgi:DNA repair/transcription protein MET18/MMS19
VKFEIWNGDNEEFIQGALEVIYSLAYAVSVPNWKFDDETNAAARFLSSILKECIERIVDYKRQYMVSTGRIILAIATASPYAFSRVVMKTFPTLMTLWHDLSYNSEKTPLLGIFNRVFQARIEVGAKLATYIAETTLRFRQNVNPVGAFESIEPLPYLGRSQVALQEVLLPFKTDLVENIYWEAMTESGSGSPDDIALRITTIRGLVLLAAIRGLLLDFEQGTILSSLNKIVFDFSQSQEIRYEATVALQQLSMNDPFRFASITLPNFMSQLPPRMVTTHWDRGEPNDEVDRIMACLNSLMEIACTDLCNGQPAANMPDFPRHAVFDTFQESILAKLLEVIVLPDQQLFANIILVAMDSGLDMFDTAVDKAGATGASPSAAHPEKHPYAWIVLKLFKALTAVKETKSNTPGGSHNQYIGLKLILGSDRKTTERIVATAGSIATRALRSKQTTPHNNFLNAGNASKLSQIWSLFCEGAPPEIDDTQMNIWDAPDDKYLTLMLSMSLVAGVNRTVCFCNPMSSFFINSLLGQSQTRIRSRQSLLRHGVQYFEHRKFPPTFGTRNCPTLSATLNQ